MEDFEIETYDYRYLQKPIKFLKLGVSRGSASCLAQGLSRCNLNGGPIAAAVNGRLGVPVGSVQPRELTPSRLLTAAPGQFRSQRPGARSGVSDSHHSITHLGKWQIS